MRKEFGKWVDEKRKNGWIENIVKEMDERKDSRRDKQCKERKGK